MSPLKKYTQSETAYIDAAFLNSMGIEAVVDEAHASTGVLFGGVVAPSTLVVPEADRERAAQLLRDRQGQETPASTPVAAAPDPAYRGLDRLLRCFLIFDSLCLIFVGIWGRQLQPVLPLDLQEYCAALVFSERLWSLAYASYAPLVFVCLLSNLLCLFYQRAGRTLYAVTTIWSLLAVFGSAAQVVVPVVGFMAQLQYMTIGVILTLMYWSPLSTKFAPSNESR